MNNSIKKDPIGEFLKRMVRPEVRGLILQYALESPLKKDILETANARKHTIYSWSKCDDCYQLWRMISINRNVNERWCLMLEEFKHGNVMCFADDSIAYEIDTRKPE